MDLEQYIEQLGWAKADHDKPNGTSLSYYTKRKDTLKKELENSLNQ